MIYLIGDSHAVVLRAPLSAALGQPVQVDAKNGTDTSYWLNRPHSADLVVVVLGTNDIYNGTPPSVSGQNAAEIEAEQGSPVLWVGPLNYARDRGTTDAIASSVRNFLDSRNLNLPMQSDGVHATGAGYRQWAQLIAENVGQVSLMPAESSGNNVDYAESPSVGGGETTWIVAGFALLILLLALRRHRR